ncbi:SDR family oxidoreductase [Schumannella luteola]|uniref:NAD(P)H dehydrogenase (Quinone) n=1 Tax=Schumannella luteola TaxID=472059 RepID=A0A852YFA1_9MICO|nr:SDR family oxidoreductase [Schumannella luteola]NYH00443.1 NAD(P)H dehydrogenase (quinone) [Schumannella luteola]TPX03646.1 SDR family oxidoreductase [Schumannella luteola]
MTILVTAAGHLGRLAVKSLIARGVAPADIRIGARTLSKVDDLVALGVNAVELDYDRPETVTAAVAGADKVLLVSASEPGKRVPQHQAVIDAAKAAGVSQLVYTSAPHADSSTLILAPEHKATEELIVASGVPATVLRNNWYHENYTGQVAGAAESGVLIGSAGTGRVASASRADYAEGAAAVLTTEGHIGQTYELAGDTAWDYAGLAAAISEITGRPVEYQNLDTAAHVAALTGFGLDEGTAGFVSALDANIAEGALAEASNVLSGLIGRPTTPLVDGLRADLA